ncbi:MAG: glycoside hydrolase family 32 protein [Oscillospiraceae bacterium]|nr:glycoside hydrolase family 32 protein [Oscillospiraceae bacterium]
MPKRLQYHFEPQRGWMNDPNGLCFFKGRYHAFFQHYPYAPKWGQMHWGHAVSRDLLHWEELPIALYPDQPYEDDGGCFSGSAVVKDDRLYLFYTSVSHSLGQTQSLAVSGDGIHFEKYDGNPLIPKPPAEGSRDFRDPKVSFFDGCYHMVCGTGKDGVGKVVHYCSDDLLRWEYQGVLAEGVEYGAVIECPDFFKFGDHYVLMFSQMDRPTHSSMFLTGAFDGERFTVGQAQTPEAGPQFYAPQSFEAPDGRRIVIGWLYDWKKELDQGADYAGALTLPREFSIAEDGTIRLSPVREAAPLLTERDELVTLSEREVLIAGASFPVTLPKPLTEVKILKDTKTVEVFLNGGEASYTLWFGK